MGKKSLDLIKTAVSCLEKNLKGVAQNKKNLRNRKKVLRYLINIIKNNITLSEMFLIFF